MVTRSIPEMHTVRAALRDLGYSGETAVADFQRDWDLPVTGTLEVATIIVVVDVHEAHRVGKHHQHPHPCHAVVGTVSSPSGAPAPGLTVRLFEQRFRDDLPLGATTTDAAGGYQAAYPRALAQAKNALLVRVFDGEEVVAESAPQFAPPPLLTIDLTVAEAHARPPSELEQIVAEVSERTAHVPIASLGDADATFLAGATGRPRASLVDLVMAYRLAAADRIEPAFFYALLREGTVIGGNGSPFATRVAVDLTTPLQPLFYDIVLLDRAKVSDAVAQAVTDRVVPGRVTNELDGIFAVLAQNDAAARQYRQTQQPMQMLGNIAANIAAGKQQEIMAAVQGDSGGDPQAIVARLGGIQLAPADGGGAAGGAAATAAQLVSQLLAANPTLLDDLRSVAALAGGQPATAAQRAPASGKAAPTQAPQRAATTTFVNELRAAAPDRRIPHHQAIGELLAAHPAFDLAHDDLDDLLADGGNARGDSRSAGTSQAAPLRGHLKATRRVFRLAPRYAHAQALLDAGVHSAAQIAAMGRTGFADRFAAALAKPDAHAIYDRAAAVATATSLLAADLHGMANAGAAAIAPPLLAEKIALVSKDNPNLANLFQLVDMCDCQSCNAVDSPAAYLVDVLQFLDNRQVVDTTQLPITAKKNAKQILLSRSPIRRPDLGDIDLDCDNTNVPLPYIDIACELLEETVAPDPGIPFAGALAAPGGAPPALVAALAAQGLPFTAAAFLQRADIDGNLTVRDMGAVCKLVPAGAPNTWTAFQLRQTTQTADQLAAMPEYVNVAAYQALQGSQTAFHLPYDLFHEEARAYFAQFGVSRDALMTALAVGGAPGDAAIAADALDIASVEHGLIVTPAPAPAQQAVFWNTSPNDPVATLNVADTFLTRTELTYADLAVLLQRAFINPTGDLFIQHLTSSCDTTQQLIANLDDPALDRIHRFLRLEKRLGWELPTVDRAIVAARIGDGALDDACLVQLAALQRLQIRLGVAVDDLVTWFGTISTEGGTTSRYARIFLDSTALGTVDPALQITTVQANASAAVPATLGDVAASLAAAFGVAPADLAALVTALTAPPLATPPLNEAPLGNDTLTFAGLAALYGQIALARALGLSISDLLLLEGLTALNPLAGAADALRFIAEADKVAAAGVTPADLTFLLTFQASDLAARTLSDAAVTAVLQKLQAALQDAFTKNRSPYDATLTADENENAVATLMGQLPGVTADQLATVRAILDDAYVPAAPTAQAFLDGLLTPFGIDTTATDAALAALLALPAGAAPAQIEAARALLIQGLLAAVSGYLYRLAREAAVTSSVATGLALDATLAATLIDGARFRAGAQRIIDVLGADTLIDTAGVPPAPPAITPSVFPDPFAAIRQIRQMGVFAATLKPLATSDVGWLLANAGALGWLPLDTLPFDGAGAPVPYARWSALRDALGLFARYPPVADRTTVESDPISFEDVFAVAIAPGTTIVALLAKAAAVTGWAPDLLADLDARFGLSAVDLTPYRDPATWLRVETAVVLLRKLGLSVAGGAAQIVDPLAAANTLALRQSLKARYAEADWLGVLKQIYNPLRVQKRDALVAHILAANPDFTSSDDLFDHYLIDVETSSCQPTSRIVSAHGSVQLFVQRCLLGIEPTAVADVAEDSGWSQWSWMQAYRLWQANRQVFLYPENWIQPTLRDDKSEPFRALEDALQQSNLDADSITTATNGYLEAVDQIAFLEVVSTTYEQSTFTTHLFARTKGGDPPTYFYRQFVKEQTWTPWQRVDLDIKGDHLISFVRNGRLALAWPIFTASPNPSPSATVPNSTAGTVVTTETDQQWQIQIALSELANGKWTPSVTSQDAVLWPPEPSTSPLVDKSTFRFVPLDLRSAGFMIMCTIATDREGAEWIGGYSLDGCKGFPTAFQTSDVYDTDSIFVIFLPMFENAFLVNERFAEDRSEEDTLTIFTFVGRQWTKILGATPDAYRVTYPQELGLIDYVLWLLELLSGTQSGVASLQARATRGWWALPLGTFMPYFYEDGNHQYVAVPGFYSPAVDEQGRSQARTRITLSNVVALLQVITLLGQQLFAEIAQHPGDLAGAWQAFWSDPSVQSEWAKLLEGLGTFAGTSYGVEFDNHYHSLVCSLRRTLYANGIDALMARASQLQTTTFDFNAHYQPQPLVTQPYPSESIEFGADNAYPVPAYASYNWELFFHLPFEVATRLGAAQQFQDAMQWFHYVFNPMDATGLAAPQKYWRTKPFFQRASAEYVTERIDSIMNGLDTDTGGDLQNLQTAVENWRESPYEPFVVARSRTVAFQQAILMQYLNNLIGWGDSLFTQGTMESVNQATQLYILADKLLGPRPRVVPPIVTPPTETYNQLAARSIDVFGNAMLDLEDLVPDLSLLPHGGAELPPPPLTLTSLYFCLPANPNLLQYWDTIADRLFKIRNCQDINGVGRTLALFAPPIDPGALVAAAAQGLSVSQILQGLNAPLPFYRFAPMVQKAVELAQMVSAFGASLLSALEKRDAEALARLRAAQEISVQNAMTRIKQHQLDDAQAQIDVLQKGVDLTTAKSQYYHSRPFMNASETAALALNTAAIAIQTAATTMDSAAASLHLIPSLSIGVAGFGGSPSFNASFGGENIAAAMSGFASVIRSLGSLTQSGASIAATMGSYQRRQDEWTFQAAQADLELVQLQSQLIQALIRVQTALAEQAAQQVQLANAAQASQFLQSKFTNQELYDFMLSQLSSVYFASYQLALDLAHKAERCLQYELGSTSTFIGYNYWDNLHKGLQAGDLLLQDIRRMEVGYFQQNLREYELTKNVSLAMLDPDALLSLQSTGACTFSMPEALFDLDHPGHYFRRLKTVSLTIPCVAGPYATVSAKLSIVGNRYRKNTNVGAGYVEAPAGGDPRFAYNVGSIQSIATSQGQSDNGLFQLDFKDERYLPFEGQGAISSWRLEMPSAFRQLDYRTITDVVLTLKYSARDGGSGLRATVEGLLRQALQQMLVDKGSTGLFQGINLRLELPDAWYRLQQSGGTPLTITSDMLPYFTQGHTPAIASVKLYLRATGDPPSVPMSIAVGAGAPVSFTLTQNTALGNLCVATLPAPVIAFGTPFTLASPAAASLQEMSLVLSYTLGS